MQALMILVSVNALWGCVGASITSGAAANPSMSLSIWNTGILSAKLDLDVHAVHSWTLALCFEHTIQVCATQPKSWHNAG